MHVAALLGPSRALRIRTHPSLGSRSQVIPGQMPAGMPCATAYPAGVQPGMPMQPGM